MLPSAKGRVTKAEFARLTARLKPAEFGAPVAYSALGFHGPKLAVCAFASVKRGLFDVYVASPDSSKVERLCATYGLEAN